TAAPQVSDTPTPTPAFTYVAPEDTDTFDSNLYHISFDYPKGWNTSEDKLGILLTSANTFDANNPDSPPYIVFYFMKQKDLLNYRTENSILELYRDNMGVMSVNPQEIDSAPYPSAIGRSLANTQLKINGWLVLVQLDTDNYLEIYYQAPRGHEDE